MTLFFTSDTHFNHENICRLSNRPFSSLEEMTEVFVNNWNSVVTKGSVVYHLGDFALSYGRKHYDTIDQILSRLNGNKILITGNHDRTEVIKNPRWSQVCQYKELKLDLGDIHKQRIVMFHYPIRSWNQIHRGAWHLHGHCHGNLTDIGGKIMDVGVDCGNGGKPLSLEQVKSYMDARPIITCDHHQ